MEIKNKINKHPLFVSFLLGIASVYALPPFYFFPILFLSFGGLLALLAQEKNTPAKNWKIGYFFGFGHFSFGLSWIGNALLIDAGTFGWLYPVTLIAGGAFFGLFTAFPVWLAGYFKKPVAMVFALSGLWGASEWFRSFFLTGFPWNLLGSALSFSELSMQTVSLYGTYGLSSLIILITASPTIYFPSRTRKNLCFSFILPLILTMFIIGFGAWRLNSLSDLEPSDITVRIVQPAIPQDMKWERSALEKNFIEYITLSQSPGLEDIDFVIWGETASPFPLDRDEEHRRMATTAIPTNGHLITGLVRYEGTGWENYTPFNSMFVINHSGDIVASYDKSHLVPFGEYIPLRQYLPDWIRPVTGAIANFGTGNGPENINIGNYPAFSSLICYEIIFPHQIVNPKSKPQWLINLTNDGWYGISQGPYQHFAATRLRAVEEGLTIIRAANSGISAVISPSGKIIASLSLNQRGYIDAKLPTPQSVFTIYNRYGNNIPLILSFLNIIVAFYIYLHKF